MTLGATVCATKLKNCRAISINICVANVCVRLGVCVCAPGVKLFYATTFWSKQDQGLWVIKMPK